MEPKVTPEQVHEYLASLGDFHKAGALTVEQADPGEVRIRWHHQEAALRPGGYVSGPTLFSIADLCGWVLVFTTEGITPMAVTTNLNISFLRPAVGSDVIATARQIKRGRSIMFGDVTMAMADDPDRIVTHATVSYAIPPKP